MASLFAEDELVHEPNLARIALEGDVLEHDIGAFLGLTQGLDLLQETLSAESEVIVGIALEAFIGSEESNESHPLLKKKIKKKGNYRKPVEGIFTKIYRKMREMLKWLKSQFLKVFRWVIGLFRSKGMADVNEKLTVARKNGHRTAEVDLVQLYKTFRLTGIYRSFLMTNGTKELEFAELVEGTKTIITEIAKPFAKSTGVQNEEDVRAISTEIQTAMEFVAATLIQDKTGEVADLFSYGYQGNDKFFERAIKKRFRKGHLVVDLRDLERISTQGLNGSLYTPRDEKDMDKALDKAVELIRVIETGDIPNINSEIIQMLRQFMKVIRATIAMMQQIGKFIASDIKKELTKMGDKK